jgi:hypothetical protein
MELHGHDKNPKHYCKYCKYITDNKKDFNKHLATAKHQKKEQNFKMETLETKKSHTCSCLKQFKTRNGLWKHKKICSLLENNEKKGFSEKDMIQKEFIDKELFMTLLKQNAELLEIVKNGTHNITNNTTNNTNNNCNNKSFNLQFFLNETCKDAMNIMDFVNSIELQLSDLESVGELGYVKGISNIILKHLKALDVTQRPVHCSDAKREVLYIKDNDVWEKEDHENNKMRKAVKYISHKNTKLLPLWKEKNPDCQNYYSSKSDKYNYMVIEAMGGMGENYAEKEDKIIRNIAKEVIIEK